MKYPKRPSDGPLPKKLTARPKPESMRLDQRFIADSWEALVEGLTRLELDTRQASFDYRNGSQHVMERQNRWSEEWKRQNPEKVLEYHRVYRATHPEKSREYSRRYRAKQLARNAAYYAEHSAFMKEEHKQRREHNDRLLNSRKVH